MSIRSCWELELELEHAANLLGVVVYIHFKADQHFIEGAVGLVAYSGAPYL